MTILTPMQEELCATSRWDFSDLRAVYINCTLKRSPEPSHTQGLADRTIAIMERNGVGVEQIRAVDHKIATGVYPDMTEHGWPRDDWPAIFEQVRAGWIGEAGRGRATSIPARAARATTSATATRRS